MEKIEGKIIQLVPLMANMVSMERVDNEAGIAVESIGVKNEVTEDNNRMNLPTPRKTGLLYTRIKHTPSLTPPYMPKAYGESATRDSLGAKR